MNESIAKFVGGLVVGGGEGGVLGGRWLGGGHFYWYVARGSKKGACCLWGF